MVRRTVLYLLAGVSMVLAPLLSAGQDSGTSNPVHRSRSNYLLPRAFPPNRPVREPARVNPPLSINPGNSSGLSGLVRAAGIIFSGTVTRVQRRTWANTQTVSTVAITFHVENALREALPGVNSQSMNGLVCGPVASATVSGSASSSFFTRAANSG